MVRFRPDLGAFLLQTRQEPPQQHTQTATVPPVPNRRTPTPQLSSPTRDMPRRQTDGSGALARARGTRTAGVRLLTGSSDGDQGHASSPAARFHRNPSLPLQCMPMRRHPLSGSLGQPFSQLPAEEEQLERERPGEGEGNGEGKGEGVGE